MPDRFYIGMGVSAGFLVVAFFLGGFYDDLKWRRKQKRYGGYIR